jgi:hypothetical protein
MATKNTKSHKKERQNQVASVPLLDALVLFSFLCLFVFLVAIHPT